MKNMKNNLAAMAKNGPGYCSDLNIGDRLEIESSFCTVRYIGVLFEQEQQRGEKSEQTQGEQENVIIIGIEWDNDHCGKTKNGILKGTQYFEPRRKNCLNSSFYRLNSSFRNKYISNVRKSFSRYITDLFESDYHNQAPFLSSLNQLSLDSQKSAELVGFDEEKRKKMLLKSESLDLSYCKIWTYLDEEHENFKIEKYQKYFDRVTALNISYNLISKAETVHKIIAWFPNLQTLIMNGLRFSSYKLDYPLFSPSLRFLNLSNHQTPDVLQLLPDNQEFEVLDLSKNNLGALEQTPIAIKKLDLSSLHSVELNLSFNDLQLVPHISETVRHLNISNNQISQNMNEESQKRAYLNMLSLNIGSNKISHWDGLHELVINIFPQLSSLNFNKNVIQTKNLCESSDDIYENVIARLPHNITCLDYNSIVLEEQKDCQRYLINKWKRGEIPHADLLLVRLLEQNNISVTYSNAISDVQNSSSFLCLDVLPYNFKIRTLKTCTVRYLKFQIFERLGKPAKYYDYYKNMTVKYRIVNEVYETFKYDFTPLSDYNIQTNDKIFVSFVQA